VHERLISLLLNGNIKKIMDEDVEYIGIVDD